MHDEELELLVITTIQTKQEKRLKRNVYLRTNFS